MHRLFSVFLLTASLLLGQQPAKQVETTRIFNPDGWTIPGLERARSRVHGRNSPSDKQTAVQVTGFEPGPRGKLYTIPLITPDPEHHQLDYQTLSIEPIDIYRYEVNGRVYCYQVSIIMHEFDPKSKRGGTGGGVEIYYYDETGSGVFTIMEFNVTVFPYTPPPPQWVTSR
jgi:hypothetical protein